MPDLVEKARRFATQGQRRIDEARKNTGKPYDAHLKAVAALVATVTEDPRMLAAAWLHDIVEDTPVTLDEIEREFNGEIAGLVHELTDTCRPGRGGPAARRAEQVRHFAKASPAAKSVKLADLIETCHTVCKRTPELAPAWLREMDDLLGVLPEGDARLLRRARMLVEQYGARFGMAPPVMELVDPAAGGDSDRRFLSKHARMLNTFTRLFTADEVSEPLHSFDDVRRTAEVGAAMERLGLRVAGVRRDGAVAGYLRADQTGTGTCGAACNAFKTDQVVSVDAPLADVIEVLTRYDFCFVAPLGEVSAVIQRSDMLKPVVRMWLFGLLTLMEQEVTGKINTLWPDEGWRALLAPARLDQAVRLREERLRRGQPSTLLDCLQLADKLQIALSDPQYLAAFGFKTRSTAQRVIRDVESLRNNLAHAQDIVAHDWPQIIRIARRIEGTALPRAGAVPPTGRRA